MQTLTLILALVSIVSVIALIIVLIILARNVSSHALKIPKTLQNLKENLEQQISTLDNKIKTHSEGQKQWEGGIRNWAQEELKAQAAKYELHVKGIHEALDKIGTSREGIANEITRFVRVFVAALKGERALFEELTRVALPGGASQPPQQQKTASSKSNELGEGPPPPSS